MAHRSVVRTAYECARADLAPLAWAIASAARPLARYALDRLTPQVVASVAVAAGVASIAAAVSYRVQPPGQSAAQAAVSVAPAEIVWPQSTGKTDRLDAYVREARAIGGAGAFGERASSSDASPLVWPLANRITTGVRVGPNGERMYGIRIAVPVGTPVRAAAKGVVEFAGNSTDGYGKKIVVKHGAIETVYAHVSEILVKKSDKVRKGQLIAKSGQSGFATTPRLYLGILGGGDAVDPISLFSKAGMIDRCATGSAPCRTPAKPTSTALNLDRRPVPPSDIPARERTDNL